MNQNNFNIIIGLKTDKVQQTESTFRKILSNVNINLLNIATTKDELENLIILSKYNVLITKENLDCPLEKSFLKQLRRDYPALNIIVVFKDEKRGGAKLGELFLNGIYNCIFTSDVDNSNMLEHLINEQRSEEEAFEYYGLVNNAAFLEKYQAEKDAKQSTPASSISSTENANFYSDIAMPSYSNDTNNTPPTTNGTTVAYTQPAQVSTEIPVEPVNANLSFKEDATPADANENIIPNSVTTKPEHIHKEPVHEDFIETVPEAMTEETVVAVAYQETNTDVQVNHTENNTSESNYIPEPTTPTANVPKDSSISIQKGYILSVLSDSAIIVEVKDAHFLSQPDLRGRQLTIINEK